MKRYTINTQHMFDKKISEIELNDIKTLIDNSVQEGKTIEFKGEYSLSTDREKGEFLADVSSFSNTVGGDLIFGLVAESGIAKRVQSFNVDSADEQKLKIENIIREGINPRITADIKFIKADESSYILIIRARKSWQAPHRVVFTGYSKTKDQFYARNSAGKYSLDVIELKNAFNLADSLSDRIKNFRMQRISEIVSDNAPIPLHTGAKIILQLVPIESFSPNNTFNLSRISEYREKLNPIYTRTWSHRINLDGLLTFSGNDNKDYYTYTQLYRTGIIEAVDEVLLWPDKFGEGPAEKNIPSYAYEYELLNSLKQYLDLLQSLEVNLPILVFLTLTGVNGYEMAVDKTKYRNRVYKIDRDIINLPEHLIQSYQEKPGGILKPMFDLIWNACGLPHSFNFDKDGEWIKQ